MVKKCAIPGCKSESYAGCGKSFFKFPTEESLRKKWLDAIPSNTNIKNYSVICSLHFRPQDLIVHFSVSKLKSDAVPTTFPKVIPPEKKIAVLSDMVIRPAPVIDEEVFVQKPGNISVLEFRQPKRAVIDNHEASEDQQLIELLYYVENEELSYYKKNILFYMAGCCARNISEKLSCKHCLAALFITKHDDHDYLHTVDVCKVSSFTSFVDRGELKHVSKFVFQIILYTEQIFKFHSSESIKHVSKNKIILLVLQNFYGILRDFFVPPHPVQSFQCEDSHEMQLIKGIASYYLTARLMSHGQTQTLKIRGQKTNLRQKLHKTVLFSNV